MGMPKGFVVGRAGEIELDEVRYRLSERDLGTLAVPSGRLAVLDPFAAPDEPVVVDVPPGAHRLTATLATDLESAWVVNAAMTLHLAEGEPVEVVRISEDAEVPVDGGFVAVVDAAAARTIPVGEDGWYSAVSAGEGGHLRQVRELDGPDQEDGVFAVTVARDGEELVLLRTDADMSCPVLATRDVEGRVLALHVDMFGMVEGDDDEDGADEDADEEDGDDEDGPPRAPLRRLTLDPGYAAQLPAAMLAWSRLPELVDEATAAATPEGVDDLTVADRAGLDAFAAGLPPSARILEIGCRTGRVAHHLADGRRTVIGVDPAPAMIAEGRRRHPALDLREAALEELPLEDGSVDGIVTWLGLDQVPIDTLTIVGREMGRVLRPGGEAYLTVSSPSSQRDLALRWQDLPEDGGRLPVWELSQHQVANAFAAAELVVVETSRHLPTGGEPGARTTMRLVRR